MCYCENIFDLGNLECFSVTFSEFLGHTDWNVRVENGEYLRLKYFYNLTKPQTKYEDIATATNILLFRDIWVTLIDCFDIYPLENFNVA